jgi:hypothetical protein
MAARRIETLLFVLTTLLCVGASGGCVGVIQPPGVKGDPSGGSTPGDGSGGDTPAATASGGTDGTIPSGTATGGTGAGTATGGTGAGTATGGAGAATGTGGMPTGMRSTPGDLPLPRLSHDEYLQTVQDLVTSVLPSDATAILGVVMPLTASLATDSLVTVTTEKHGGFARIDQSEQQQYSDVPISVAIALGKEMTSTSARINTVFGSCSKNGSVDTACLKTFVQTFGPIALRHTLAADEAAFYAGTAQADPPSKADLANVIAVMLASPRFLYRVESGDQQVDGSTYRLDAWELASRLSYHFWGTMPDATLRSAAASGKLLTDDGYASEVNRLVADARADVTRRTFFQQWLWPLLELPALDSRASDPAFKAFAGTNLPGPTLKDHMVKDVLDAASWVTSHGGTVVDLLTNRQSFAKDADLAGIYGIAPWNGMGDPPMLPAERAGLLTRPAFLSTGTTGTRPIMKGVFIRETLLCDAIPPPPANAAATAIVITPAQTTRQTLVALTEASGTVCAGCHKALINPLGFASENFDGLGRARTQESFYDTTGKLVGTKPVDTSSVPGVVAGDPASSTGIADVTQLIAKSDKVQACLAAKYFRFAFRRIETAKDTDAITGLAQLAKTGTLGDLFMGVALRPEFKQRVISQ